MVTTVPTGPETGDKPVMLGGGSTVTVVEPQSEPVHALTVTEPVAAATALPRSLASFEIVAIVLSEEFQVTEARVCVLLSLNVPVAVKGSVAPTETD